MRRGTAAILALIALTVIPGCDDDSGSPTAAPATQEPAPSQPGGYGARPPTGGEDQPDEAPPEDADAPPPAATRSDDDREVRRAVHTYLLGLDAGDGGRVCSVLAPNAIDDIELPEDRGDCAASLTASIGYRDPRGLPVFEGLEPAGVRAIEIEGDEARARATTVTTFADRKEPSIEDDVIYLSRFATGWHIVKPSAILYRAVGIADVPPSVLAPPGG